MENAIPKVFLYEGNKCGAVWDIAADMNQGPAHWNDLSTAECTIDDRSNLHFIYELNKHASGYFFNKGSDWHRPILP